MDLRIKPISKDMVSIQIDCICGDSTKSREFCKHSVSGPTLQGERSYGNTIILDETSDHYLVCNCHRRYLIKVQRDHFHVIEGRDV